MIHKIMIDLREYGLRRRRLKWSRLYNVNSILPHEEGWHARIEWGSTAYVDLSI